MNIIEAISNNLSDVTELSTPYIGRIYVDGIVNIHKPVDVRINRISIPLAKADLNFIYDTVSNYERVHKSDANLDTYYPIGSQFAIIDGRIQYIGNSNRNITVIDGLSITDDAADISPIDISKTMGISQEILDKGLYEIESYGPVKKYNNKVYVDIFCKFKSEKYKLVEAINGSHIESKVRYEMNNIIESNEIIKGLLPQYDHNFLKFSDDDIDAIEKFNAMNVLSVFNSLEYQERYAIMENVNSAIDENYINIPTSVVSAIKEISEISLTPMIDAGFMEYHAKYNPRYVFEGLIYIFENMLLNDESLYNEFYLVNKLDERCKITIEKNGSVLIFKFDMPSECKNNYVLEVYNWSNYGQYIKYGMDNIRLYSINKDTLEKTENTNVSVNQGNYLKVCTEIFGILSATNYSNMTLSEYYDNVDTLLNNIKTTIVKEETDDDNTGEA